MKTVTTTSQFILRYAQKPAIPPIASRYLAAHTHPIRPKILHLYENRDRGILWWRVSVQQLQQHKRVIRSWCARRARIAFRQALVSRGFDAQGRRIAQDTQGLQIGKNMDEGLKGSVDIIIRPQSVREDYSMVQKEMDSLLDTLLQQSKSGGTWSKEKNSQGVR